MKAYVVRGPGALELTQVRDPVPGPEEILVRVAYCSVCGSDITLYEGQVRRAADGLVLGHEVSGIVAATGERVRDLKVGDRVALEPAIPCRRCWFCVRGQYHMCPHTRHLGSSAPGGFAEYLTIPELNAHRVPSEIPLREAALLEPMGVCLAGLRRARLQMGETVAIFGDGPFGAIFARLAEIMGARDVWVMGHHDWRLERIRGSHTRAVNTHRDQYLPELLEATEGRGADVVVASTDSPAVYPEMLEAVRIQGRVLAFSFPHGPVQFDMSRVQMREVEIIGTCRCPHTFETLMDLMCQGKLQPSAWISDVLPLAALPEALARARSTSKEVFKILIRLSGEGDQASD